MLGLLLATALAASEALINAPGEGSDALQEQPESIYDVAGVPLPVVVLLAAVLAFLVATTARAALQKRRGQQWVGPLDAWLGLVTGWPLTVAAVGVMVPASLSFLGLRASGYSVVVDWDVANYMQSDSETAFMSRAVDHAVKEQKATLSDDTSARRLQVAVPAQSLKYWSMTFFYTAKGDNVFTPEALAEIKGFEQAVQQFPGYADHCFKDGGVECRLPRSVVNVFHPSASPAAEENYAFVSYDGLGSLADINSTLRAMIQQGVSWWVDADFDAKYLKSKNTRSLFYGGLPLDPTLVTGQLVVSSKDMRAHGDWLRKLFDDFLMSANDNLEHITVTWHEGRDLSSHEVITILIHDISWAMGSFLFVAGFLLFQTRSMLLSTMAISSIAISFTTAFYFYGVVAGFSKMYLVNFMSLFLVVGISADNVLILSQTYALARARTALRDLGPVEHMRWAYYRAGSATLFTTATTCTSFFSLMLSSMPVLRGFGFYMGTVVAVNYANTMVVFAAVLVLRDRLGLGCPYTSCCRPTVSAAVGPQSTLPPASPRDRAAPSLEDGPADCADCSPFPDPREERSSSGGVPTLPAGASGARRVFSLDELCDTLCDVEGRPRGRPAYQLEDLSAYQLEDRFSRSPDAQCDLEDIGLQFGAPRRPRGTSSRQSSRTSAASRPPTPRESVDEEGSSRRASTRTNDAAGFDDAAAAAGKPRTPSTRRASTRTDDAASVDEAAAAAGNPKTPSTRPPSTRTLDAASVDEERGNDAESRGSASRCQGEEDAMERTSNPSTVSSFDQVRLGMSVRFFAGTLRDIIWRIRYPAVPALILAPGLGCLMAVLSLSLATKAPQVFAERTNLGRQQSLLTGDFGSYDVDDLNKALDVFSPSSSSQLYCPGVLEGGAVCSGHGVCDHASWTCGCEGGYEGADCSISVRPGELSVGDSEVHMVAVQNNPGGLYVGGLLSEDLTIQNVGDTSIVWSLSIPEKPWISVRGSTNGTLGPRQIDGSVTLPTEYNVLLEADLWGQQAGWEDSESLVLHWGHDGVWSFGTQHVLVRARVLEDLVLSGLSLSPAIDMSPPFSPSVQTYSATLPFPTSEVQVRPSFSPPTEQVKVQDELVTSGGLSGAVALEPGGEVRVSIVVMAADAEEVTYVLRLARAQAEPPPPPVLNRVVAEDSAIRVWFEPSVDEDGFYSIAGYRVVVYDLDEESSQEDTVTCSPAPCWSQALASEASGLHCCEHQVVGLRNGAPHIISVRAVSQYGESDPSIPAMCPGSECWPWEPVTPRATAELPSISQAPQVTVVNAGEVRLDLSQSSIHSGDAMPLRFTCYASPGGASGSNAAGVGIFVVGLSPSTGYTFSCEVATARLATGAGAVTGTSPKSAVVFPGLPGSAHLVDFELELEIDDSLLLSLSVDGVLGAILEAVSLEIGVPVGIVDYELLAAEASDRRLAPVSLALRITAQAGGPSELALLIGYLLGAHASDMSALVSAAVGLDVVVTSLKVLTTTTGTSSSFTTATSTTATTAIAYASTTVIATTQATTSPAETTTLIATTQASTSPAAATTLISTTQVSTSPAETTTLIATTQASTPPAETTTLVATTQASTSPAETTTLIAVTQASTSLTETSTSRVSSTITSSTVMTSTSRTITSRTITSMTATASRRVPNPPKIVQAGVSGDREISVEVVLTSFDGDMPIELLVCDAGGLVANLSWPSTSAANSVVFTELAVSSIIDDIWCTASNALGTSKPSTTWYTAVTVLGLPLPPNISQVYVSGDAQLTVFVTHDSEHQVVSVFCVSAEDDSLFQESVDGIVPFLGLDPGEAYVFRCASSNAAGVSALSSPSDPVVAVVSPGLAFACVRPSPAQVELWLELPTGAGYDEVVDLSCGPVSSSARASGQLAGEGGWHATVGGLPNLQALQVSCEIQTRHGLHANAVQQVVCGTPVVCTYTLEGWPGPAGPTAEADLQQLVAAELQMPLIYVRTSLAPHGESLGCASSSDAAGGLRRLSADAAAGFQLLVEVLVEDESDANIPALLEDLRRLASDGVLASNTATAVSILSGPLVSHALFFDSSLESLAVLPGRLFPEFDPTVLRYSVNVTSLVFSIAAKASSPLSSWAILDGHEMNVVAAVAPASQLITVRVQAGDFSTTSYEVEVFFQPVGCNSDCGQGACDLLTGTCRCVEGWHGPNCTGYCPGNPACSGRGACGDESGRCECDNSYGGDDCTTRVCPPCLHNGTCREGQQTPDADWGCDCPEARTGELCELWRCPSDCSSAGECDGGSGACLCYPGYSGADCGVKDPKLYPIEFCLDVSLLWGIQGYRQDGVDFLPERDPMFRLDAATQQWLLDTCAAARADDSLRVRGEVQCFMEAFRSWRQAEWGEYIWADLSHASAFGSVPAHLSLPAAGDPVSDAQLSWIQLQTGFDFDALLGMGLVVAVGSNDSAAFPISHELVSVTIENFFDVDRHSRWYRADVGTNGRDYSGDITYVRQRLSINVPYDTDLHELESEYHKWASFVEARNRAAPPGAKMIIDSPWITRMFAELSIVDSTFRTLSFSVFGCFVVVMVFTRNWLLSVYTILTTILSMSSLLFFIICVLGWEFGAVQVIGFTTFIGLAVDYTVHTSHAYQMSDKFDRRSRVTDALKHAGTAIVGGAFTTGGATVFLLPCLIVPFYQLGVMLILNTTITVLLTFFFLMPVLMVCGPMGQCGQMPRLFGGALRERVPFMRRTVPPPPPSSESALDEWNYDDQSSDYERAVPARAIPAIPHRGGHLR